MNLTVAFLIPYIVLCAWLFLRAPRGMFLLYPIALLVMPTIKFLVGAPIYPYDVLGLLIIAHVLRMGGLRAWPQGVAPWHGVMLALLLASGLLVPAFRYGPTAVSAWVTFHASLAFLQILTAVALLRMPGLKREAHALALGITVALVILAVIAALEFGNPAMSGVFNHFFYRDTGRNLLSDWGAQLVASRVTGPYGNPNGLAVAGLIAAFVVWWLDRGRLSVVSFLSVAVILVATVSRQAILASVLCFAIYMFVAGRRTLGYLAAVLVTVPLALPLLSQVSVLAPIIERFSRWNGGALNDRNVAGRLIDGPQRLWNLIGESPDMLFFGAGWDVQKLTSQGVDTGIYATGFVSNAYLLWLYHAGVLGLLFIILLLWSAVSASMKLPRLQRAKGLAVIIPIMFLYFSDNGPILIEAIIVGISMNIGAIYAWLPTPKMAQPARNPIAAPRRQPPGLVGG